MIEDASTVVKKKSPGRPKSTATATEVVAPATPAAKPSKALSFHGYPLSFIFQAVNEIENAFIQGKVAQRETLDRLYGVKIVLNQIESLHHDSTDEMMAFALERENTGITNLINMLETILQVAATSDVDDDNGNGNEVYETVVHQEQQQPPKKDNFIVECKCGANYTTKHPAHWKRSACRQCSKTVYTDRERGRVTSDLGPALVMTNCYYVNPNGVEPVNPVSSPVLSQLNVVAEPEQPPLEEAAVLVTEGVTSEPEEKPSSES